MRNLKKILALALALVMSLSLMATANAFTDDDSINDTYETAVTVLSGLKVFQGYDDGSFQPKGAITRAEVAAIIYRIVTGDVADTQVGIYADYNKFDDVASTSWYAGYVNFCANAEYIKGYDARTFGPNDPVTGYQALAMILRALGYDKNGEFTGTNWQVQTAAVGENRGITKNITAGTLGVPATREVVAEILFRAILVPTVNYTPAFGYTIGDTSLGYKTFGLEDIVGVVVANEYADLYSDSPMKAGRTELDVDGESYVIDYSTTLEDIGEAQHAYVAGSTVLAIADAGNTVFETGAATDIGSDSDFEDVTSLERGDATEQFINFDNATVYEAQIRIVYDVDGDGAAGRVSIGDGDELTQAQYDDIKAIFTDDDYTSGWVIVGTKYKDDAQAKEDDVSNDMKFSDFVDEYLEGEFNGTDIDETDNGEWLKVIDNDGDGVADYVLLTEFAMSFIDRISKDNEYTLADLAGGDAVRFDRNTVEIDGGDIATEDELAEGDVVIYTLIDGKYYMNIAEKVTETVDKKGIDKHDETMTCDGTVYTQSHIGYTNDTYYHDVTEAHTEETYDLYLDHFGFVRLFIESDYNTFMLLTDGWYEDDNRTETFQAYYWDVEADEETLIDVVDDDDNFISNGQRGDEETWGNLWGADVTYDLNGYTWPNTFASNIAGYTETDDGYDLKSVEDSAERIDYRVQAINVTASTELDDPTLKTAGDDIQTTTDTQYYLVIRSADNRTASGWNVDDVITWTGYKNAPAEAELNFEDGPVVAYAVTRATKTTGAYTVADVVVFETEAYSDRDTYFVYDVNNWNPIEYVYGIGYDDEGAIFDENKLLVEDGAAVIRAHEMIEFYKIYDDERVDFIGDVKGEYAANYIYAGETKTGYDVENRNYIRVDVFTKIAGEIVETDDMYIPLDAPIYYVDTDGNGDYVVKELSRDKVDPYDKLIVFANKDDKVQYAIDVTASVDDNGNIFDDLYNEVVAFSAGEHDGIGLWNRIVYDTVSINYVNLYKQVIAQAEAALAANDLDELKLAKAALEELLDDENAKDELTANQIARLGAAYSQVGQAIAVLEGEIEDAQTAQEAVAALNAAWEAFDDAAGAAKEAAREALAEALLNYNKLEPTMTAEQKKAAELNKAKAENEIKTYVEGAGKPDATETTYADIEGENEKAVALKGSKLLEAYKALANDAGDKAIDDAIAAVEKQYAEATEDMALINALIDAYEDHEALPNDSTKAALLAAFSACKSEFQEDGKANKVPSALLGTDYDSKYLPAWYEGEKLANANDAALIAKAKDALDKFGKDWAAFTGEDLDADALKDEICRQVDAVLTAADAKVTYTLTGVTVPSLGETKKVYFQINFTDGTTQVGNNKFDVTNNYSAASVKAAVEAALSSKTAAAASYGLDTLAAYVSNQIKTVSGVTDVKVTPNGQPSSWTVDTMVYYNYEYTYGGETYTGSTYFKLV